MKNSAHNLVAQRVISAGVFSLNQLATSIPADFDKVVELILNFKGRVILTGIGKSGYIARKIAASMASTGTLAFYIHPAEASHGDLGMIGREDIVIMLSNSGQTKELDDIINYCQKFSIKIIAVTMQIESNLARNSDYLLNIPITKESSTISAPTTSILMMLAMGDALAVAVQEAKQFSKKDFSLYHPGGKIGIDLLKLEKLIYCGENIPIVYADTNLADIIIIMNLKRLGCAVVVDNNCNLIGIITNRELKQHIKDEIKIKCAKDVMNANPIKISFDSFATEAWQLINHYQINILPVVNNNKLVGLLLASDLVKAGLGFSR